jgi:5-formyltetrahydrofolate cyclo-ligase
MGELGARVLERLKTLQAYQDARRVSIFLSMPGGEIQTDPIVRHAFESGKEVFVPYLHKSPAPLKDTPVRVMDMVRLQSLKDYESLERDKWGIPSIDPKSVDERQRILGAAGTDNAGIAELDMMLMPGVAFDVDTEKHIRRLGHGKGFYDFFIQRYRSRAGTSSRLEHSMVLCALALVEQLLAAPEEGHVPVGPLDQPLDALILGSGEVIEASRSSEC